jgi:hypothetical protein
MEDKEVPKINKIRFIPEFMKYYTATTGYAYRLSNRIVSMNANEFERFIDAAKSKAGNYSEQIELCFYEKRGNDVHIQRSRLIEMEEIRRGTSLTYRSKNRPALIEEAKGLGLLADAILHSHPVNPEDLKKYQKGVLKEQQILETYAPLSVGDFIFMERWKDPFRGVVIATPEEYWGPYWWFWDRETLDVSLVNPERFTLTNN